MQTWTYQRQVPVEQAYDVVVAGGGPSGVAAAISAARLGKKVLLVEATGALGGMGTSGLVAHWCSLSDGVRVLPRGLFWEVLQLLSAQGQLPPGVDLPTFDSRYCVMTGFQAEGLKRILDQLCAASGVDLLLCTRVIDVDVDAQKRRVRGVLIHHVEGIHYVPTKAAIDATGDAILANLCGCEVWEAGRDSEHIMPPTLCSVATNIDWERFSLARQHEDQKIAQGISDGFFTQPDRHVPGLFRSANTSGILNAGHLFGMNALKVRSLTNGYQTGRKLAAEYIAFFKKYFDGCEKLELAATASLMGVRESRRIVGEYELNYDDFKCRRHFPDQVGVYNKAVDVHVYDTSDEQWLRYKEEFRVRDNLAIGESYGLPYGILVPRGWTNLWVTGRAVSADVKMHGAIRDQPACFVLGQAAGTAAVQSINTGEPANELDVAKLIESLRASGAYLPQTETTRKMTRRGGSN